MSCWVIDGQKDQEQMHGVHVYILLFVCENETTENIW